MKSFLHPSGFPNKQQEGRWGFVVCVVGFFYMIFFPYSNNSKVRRKI